MDDPTHVPYMAKAINRLGDVPDTKLTPAAIKLRAWMMRTKHTTQAVAMKCGYSASTINEYVIGRPNSYPSLTQAFAIEWLTNGEVQAWEWLDNPYIEHKVRMSQASAAMRFESIAKSFVLKYNSLKTADGMLRHKARILSRLFGVNWGEVKKRCWEDARKKARLEQYDTKTLFADITQEECDAQD